VRRHHHEIGPLAINYFVDDPARLSEFCDRLDMPTWKRRQSEVLQTLFFENVRFLGQLGSCDFKFRPCESVHPVRMHESQIRGEMIDHLFDVRRHDMAGI
jgi:hypothetical protein